MTESYSNRPRDERGALPGGPTETKAPPSPLAQALDVLAKNKTMDGVVGLLFVKANDGYSVVPVTRATYATPIQRSEGRAMRTIPSLLMADHVGADTPEGALDAYIDKAGWGPGAEPIMPEAPDPATREDDKTDPAF